MNKLLLLVPALLSGFLLGFIFFGGLWWTVQKGLSAKNPAFWFLGSWLLRTAITVSGFYIISDGNWQKLLACLLGFFFIRLFITRFTERSEINSIANHKESRHAP